jgi:light-regulated signal transduction histidine kinase (bacteriophytochrome)
MYRFDEDDHGSVIAESRDPHYEPYLGLHYPASDVPRQARELYKRNWLRLIPDAAYEPAPIVPPVRGDTRAPVDLTFAVLRSVSPVHREYLANMGVRASMSISIVVGDRLWGLISCGNHSAARFVGHHVRAACETVGRLVSLQVPAIEERERAALRSARATFRDALADAMRTAREDDDLLESLLGRPAELLALVDATGAAVLGAGSPRTSGRVPDDAVLGELAEWLETNAPAPTFATSSLSRAFPGAAPAAAVASGALTLRVPGAAPGSPARRVVWFRPELVETVFWGGDPRKPAQADGDAELHPRRSFEKWKEEVRSCAERWSQADIDAVEELRRTAVEIDLVRQLDRARKAVRVRDDLVAVVSHDLRNPLSVIQMQTALLLRATVDREDEPTRRLRGSVERIQRSVDRMNSLITDLLDLARIEVGRFELQTRPEDVQELVDEALVIVRPLAEAKRVVIMEDAVASAPVDADRERVFQVISNLVGNAIKFTPEGGKISLSAEQRDREVFVSVSDSGPGIAEDMRKRVFERFWQAPAAARASGTGLGLYIAKGIVEAHGGRIWVDRAPDGGARFTFTLPRRS